MAAQRLHPRLLRNRDVNVAARSATGHFESNIVSQDIWHEIDWVVCKYTSLDSRKYAPFIDLDQMNSVNKGLREDFTVT